MVAATAALWLGARLEPVTSVPVGAAMVCVTLLVRRPVMFIAAVAAMGSLLGHRATSNLAEQTGGVVDGPVRVVADPAWHLGALRLDIELGGVRWEVSARGQPAWALEHARYGERWWMVGTVEGASMQARRWLWPRGVAGRGEVVSARRIDHGRWPHRVANGIRDLLATGAAELPRRDRVLITGFVYGDDRGQFPEVVDDFRATGLTHLLAVSGSNIAVVLALFAPLVRSLPPPAGAVVVAVVVGQFVVLTRAEPSVLRAGVLAVVGVVSMVLGGGASRLRLLAIAVGLLVAVDPLLVRSVGFQLSVGASLGIVLFGRWLVDRLVGPRWCREVLGMTVAAQCGVLPVQLVTFGGLPLASVPANVLVGPVAGLVMVGGLLGGIAGGLAGSAAGAWLLLPVRMLVGWVAGVARVVGALGLPELEAGELPLVVIAVIGALWSTTRAPPVIRLVLCGLLVSLVCWRDAGVASSDHLWLSHQGDTVVLVVDRPDPASAVGWVRRGGVRRVDVVIARSSSRQTSEAVRAIASRVDVGAVEAPAPLVGVPSHVVTGRARVGALVIESIGGRLNVEADVRAPPIRR